MRFVLCYGFVARFEVANGPLACFIDRMTEEKKESDWVRAAPNLVRYRPSGMYFLRARFGGTPVRECLHTTRFENAKVKLADRMAELRAARPKRLDDVRTLGDALDIVRQQVKNDPTLKDSSKRTYYDWLDDLRPGKDAAVPATALNRLSAAELEAWWARAAASYAPSRANSLFMLVKRALKVARKAGAISRDVMEDMKRLDVPPTELYLVTAEQFQLLLADIRSRSVEAPDWLEFMCYCGLRPKEVESILWEHIGADSIAVHGGPTRTKNRRVRHVPIVPAMAALLERMRDGQLRTGSLFTIKRPKSVFKGACKRLGFPKLRIYDLRHMFATVCMESGVAVPVFARWLGHQDKGKLALERYTHPTSDHERDAAAKVRF